MNNLIDVARHLPINEPVQTISVSPVALDAPGRGRPLELRITAPIMGEDLPVILLSHGHGPSLYIPSKDGYAPLANFYAEHGFVLIQPTHGNSKVAGLDPKSPEAPLFWRSRVEDMTIILDGLDAIEAATPAIAGRLDRNRVAAVGHSLGGLTVAALLGAGMTDAKDATATPVSMLEPRIKAGVLLTPPGNGGDDYTEHARATYATPDPDFSSMTTQALVVVGDADLSAHLTTRGVDWHADPYIHGPGATDLLTLFGARHGLGGVSGYDAKETLDEDPDRLAVTQRMTWAYLRSALYEADPAWLDARRALQQHASSQGRVDCK